MAKIIIKINPIKRVGHTPHRSGAGKMDNRPKRERTRKDQEKKWKNDEA